MRVESPDIYHSLHFLCWKHFIIKEAIKVSKLQEQRKNRIHILRSLQKDA